MKRVLSLVLVLVLVLGAIMPAFAEETASQAALDLETYGVIVGNGTDLGEALPLTRAQMAVLYAKLQGKATEAEAHALPTTLLDAGDAWYTPWVAYANEQEWMVGSDNMFRPLDNVTANEVRVLLLKALGHTVVWETVEADATAAGIEMAAADATLPLGSEVFAAVRAIVDMTPVDGTDTLGTVLALTDYVAPVVEEEVTDLEVVSVTALNLFQVEVVYNQEVDATSAAKVANYSLTDVTAGAVTVADAAVQEDNMTVVLTLDIAAAQQDVVDVTVEDVETPAEAVMADATIEDVTFLDTVIPTVVGAETVGNDTIKVIFSEPVVGDEDSNAGADVDTINELPNANFEVNDGNKLYIKSVKLQNNNTEALVELYSVLKDGTVDIKVLADTEDFAGFGVTVKTETVTVAEDKDAPVVTGYKDATPTSVTLIWSEDLEINAAAAAGFYHTNSGNPIDANLTASEIDGNEMTLKFTTNELPQGTAYVYVLKETVNDLWDNENAQQMIAIEVELDTTAPEVDGDVTVSTETEIKFNFTEDMDADTLADEDNFTLLDEDGEELDKISTTVAVDSDTVKVTFSATLSGDYSIVVKDLEDVAGNTIADVTLPFSVDDLTSPVPADFTATIYNPGAADQMIRINFADVMAVEGAYSILDAAKYAFNDGADLMEDLDSDLIAFNVVNDGKSVEITIPSTIDDPIAGDYVGIDLDDAKYITIGKVADAAGNLTAGVSVQLAAGDISDEGTIANPTVEVTALDTVVMTFAEEVTKLELTDYVVEETGVGTLTVASVSTALDADGNTEVTFELVTDLAATATSNGNTVQVKATAQASENAYGEKIAAFTVVGSDEIAPSVDKIVYVNDSLIQVHFDEALKAATFAGAGMNGFTVADATGAILNVTDGKVVDIASAANFTINTNVSYNGTFGLEDATAGNSIAAFDETDALTQAKVTVVAADPVDNTFTVTNNYVVLNALVVGDIDMDTVTGAVQDAITINGITYTVTVVGGTATIAPTGTATANAIATTSSFTILMDGHTETVSFNIAAVLTGAAGVPTVPAN